MKIFQGLDYRSALLLGAISTNHFMQRPLRDAAAAFCGAENINWLMTGTLVGTVVLTLLLLTLERMGKVRQSLPLLLLILAITQVILFRELQHPNFWSSAAYFAFNGATSISLLSLVWRRVMTTDSSEDRRIVRAYTITNVGALAGPLIALVAAQFFSDVDLLLVSSFILTAAAVALSADGSIYPGERLVQLKFPFKRLLSFTLLYTFVATGFYFILIKTIQSNWPENNRTQLFSIMDLMTNCAVVVLPHFLRKWNQKSSAFFIVPCISLILLSTLGVKITVITAITAIVIFKISNLSIQRPARELLYMKTALSTPYATKNFIDVTAYRIGDVAAAWTISTMTSAGFQSTQILFLFIAVGTLWTINGYIISKNIKFNVQ